MKKNIINKLLIIIIILGTITIIYNKLYIYKEINIEKKSINEFLNKEKTYNKKSKTTNKVDYIAILEIPKISLKKGLVNPYSKYNNVNKNVTILNPIEMPNQKNSTFLLAAHSGNSNMSYFKNLYKLKNNDVVYIYYKNKKYKYRIVDYYEQNKTGKIFLKTNYEKNIIVLTTCKQFSLKKQLIYVGIFEKAFDY